MRGPSRRRTCCEGGAVNAVPAALHCECVTRQRRRPGASHLDVSITNFLNFCCYTQNGSKDRTAKGQRHVHAPQHSRSLAPGTPALRLSVGPRATRHGRTGRRPCFGSPLLRRSDLEGRDWRGGGGPSCRPRSCGGRPRT